MGTTNQRQFYPYHRGEILKADESAFDVAAWMGDMLTAPSYLFTLAKGDIPGQKLFSKFGSNSDIDTATTPEDIWEGGGVYTGMNSTGAETLAISSDNANDTAGGTGARTVIVEGLDASYNEISETITLNGVSVVNSVNSYLRMHRMYVTTAGSAGGNQGIITTTQSVTTANVFSKMPATYNQTQIGCYTVPAGKTAYVFEVFFSSMVSGQSESIVHFKMRPQGGVFRVMFSAGISQNGGTLLKNSHPLLIAPEKSDLKLSAHSVTVNGTNIAGSFDMILVDN